MRDQLRDKDASSRLLLKRIREIMAEPLAPQDRLDRMVGQIAQSLVAEVCSVYALRADGVLELYATIGLNPNAVHLSQLRLGQGLVGTIAAASRPLNLAEAQKHPAFEYLPETGEELYHSFLGVPILRAGRTLGVLVVQNEAHRVYGDDEAEALETVAMVIGEMIATGDLKSLSSTGVELDLAKPVTLHGAALSEGIGLGHVVLHEPRVVVTNLFNDDTEAELGRLARALSGLRLTIDDMLSRGDVAFEGEHRDVLETYRMFAHDKGWVDRMEEAIRNGLTAEAGVEKVQSDMRARMGTITDPYLRERMSDFDDLANRLLRQLISGDASHRARSLPGDAIIVARNMGAAELLDYPRERVRGLVLEHGAPTSHVVIVARAMGIPVAGHIKGVVAMANAADEIIVDGLAGQVHLRPQPDVEAAYAEKVRFRARRQAEYRSLRAEPSLTADGEPFSLLMNAGLLVDLPQLEQSGAQGIGLFRTELQFMIAATFPRAEAQERLYGSVLDAAGQRPVTFRTLDIGGDKVLPYFRNAPEEENPALGWRAMRLALDRPGLLRTQVRALLKAAAGRELRLMLPMVTELAEIDRARAMITREVKHLSRFGHGLPLKLRIGAMLEVPSLLFDLDGLMGKADFVSIGSNDLFQFMHAADRGNTRIADRFDTLGPTFLRALKSAADAARRHGTPLALCGEMAGRPAEALALAALGITTLSMSPAAIGPVKAALIRAEIGTLRQRMTDALESGSTATDIHRLIGESADSSGIAL
ncbi:MULTISPECIES: phosphoenolpyruvate--protein phosphotransferase [unclassified Roseitalea]|uniref:phosphoenolpyruvate--protein phosphotransferase n=1 Tax=unclassified Roseitalea TaxID=2639107 RepID=UPI00273FBC18|nr:MULTISPECIES: phosphoenolpyruvate--protein phosphotransferase [unclassified Roseitalea]